MLIEVDKNILDQGIEALHYVTAPRIKRLVAALKYGINEEKARLAAFENDLGFDREFLLDPDDQDDNVILCLNPEPHFERINDNGGA